MVALIALLLAACGGGDGDGPTSAAAPATTVAPGSSLDGVQTFTVEAAHAEGPLTYPQTPPVGGTHNPIWQACAVYDVPVPNEKAVHSMEHGAVWITYRPDLPPADIQSLATFARGRDHVLLSPYGDGLPAPVVVTAWGRQLRLDSAKDPRLAEFVRLYINQGPEKATC